MAPNLGGPRPPPLSSKRPRARERGGDGGVVRIPTRQGTLTASVVGTGRAGVVLSPQLNQTRRYWLQLERILAKRGYTAMSIDSRYVDIDGEVLIAARYLRRNGARWVAAIGASKGGTAVLGAASRKRLGGVVAVSPVISFGDVTLTRRAIAALDTPALVIVDELDGTDHDSEQLEEWGSDAIRVVHVNAGGAHGTSYLDSGKRQVFVRMILDFLDESRDGRV